MSIRATLPAQRLDQTITFQRKVQAPQDAATGALPQMNWEDVPTAKRVHAAIDAMKANERYLAQQIEAQGDYTVWIRWRDDIDANMRILWRGLPLDIKSIPDQQRRGRWLAIFASSGVNQG